MERQALTDLVRAHFLDSAELSAWLVADIWPYFRAQPRAHAWNERLHAEAEARKAARAEARAREKSQRERVRLAKKFIFIMPDGSQVEHRGGAAAALAFWESQTGRKPAP